MSESIPEDLSRLHEAAVGEIPPFDAWTVVGDEPEPWGSHATLADALLAIGPCGGAVTVGVTFVGWHPGTSEDDRAVLRPALQAHGVKGRPPSTDWSDLPDA